MALVQLGRHDVVAARKHTSKAAMLACSALELEQLAELQCTSLKAQLH